MENLYIDPELNSGVLEVLTDESRESSADQFYSSLVARAYASLTHGRAGVPTLHLHTAVAGAKRMEAAQAEFAGSDEQGLHIGTGFVSSLSGAIFSAVWPGISAPWLRPLTPCT